MLNIAAFSHRHLQIPISRSSHSRDDSALETVRIEIAQRNQPPPVPAAPYYLQPPSHSFSTTVREPLQPKLSALIQILDPRGHVGDALVNRVEAIGYVDFLKEVSADSHTPGVFMGVPKKFLPVILDSLLYRGAIDEFRWWTGSMMMAFWRDSQGDAEPPEAMFELGEDGLPTGERKYIPGWIDWNKSYAVACEGDTQATGSEKFTYYLALVDNSSIPEFALRLYSEDRIYRVTKKDDTRYFGVPSGTLIRNHPCFRDSQAKIALQPRLGLDSADYLRSQTYEGTRIVGVSHPLSSLLCNIPRLDKADGLFTGEGGLSLHDIEHAWVLARLRVLTRTTLIDLQKHLAKWLSQQYAEGHLKDFDKNIALPDGVKSAPTIRALLLGNVFNFVDLGHTDSYMDYTAAEAIGHTVLATLGVTLFDFMSSNGVFDRANIQRNVLRRLGANKYYYNPVNAYPTLYEDAPAHLRKTVLLESSPDPDMVQAPEFLRELDRCWREGSNALLCEALHWLVCERALSAAEMFTLSVRYRYLNDARKDVFRAEFWDKSRAYAENPTAEIQDLLPTKFLIGVCKLIPTFTRRGLPSTHLAPRIRPKNATYTGSQLESLRLDADFIGEKFKVIGSYSVPAVYCKEI